MRAARFGLNGRTTLWAELDFCGQRGVAVGTSGAHALRPGVLLQHLTVFLRHFGVRPDFLHCATCLGGGHLHTQVRGTFFAKTFVGVPATLAAYPRGATWALDKLGSYLFDGFEKGIIVCLFPGGRASALTEIRCMSKNPTKQTAGGIECAGDRA